MTEHTLIALVDGSAYSESVCYYAAWAAKRLNAKVKVYHVMGPREGSDSQDLSGAIRLGARSRLLKELSELDEKRGKLSQEQGRAILEDAQGIISPNGVVDVETRLRQGDPLDTILLKEENADLILIGKRGETRGTLDGHLGSNFEQIVRGSHKPILVANHAFKTIKNILVAFNGGTASLKAVDYIAQSPLFSGLEVSLVYAGKETPKIEKSMQEASEKLAAVNMVAKTVIKDGTPETILSQMTKSHDNQILVMGGYGHSWLRTVLTGSTTTHTIQSCKVPIFIIN